MKLSHAHIALVNASATGTEALKNLVLPGIGKFTIIDAAVVQESDLANNFFVTEEWRGKSRAQAATAFLTELNPDVQGFSVVCDGVALVKSEPLCFSKYSMVIATQLDEMGLVEIEKACVLCDVPFVIARTNGLMGHVRLSVREHRVVESKPSPEPQQDLRVFNPFPQLQVVANACTLENLDEQEFGHTPFVIVLIKALQKWQAAHGGKAPANMADKASFVASI